LLEDWANNKYLIKQDQRDQNAHYNEAKRVVDELVVLTGDKPMSDYKREDLIALKRAYHDKKLKTVTRKKYLGLLKALILHGVKNELIAKDPFPVGGGNGTYPMLDYYRLQDMNNNTTCPEEEAELEAIVK
jgi:hypothetical protein